MTSVSDWVNITPFEWHEFTTDNGRRICSPKSALYQDWIIELDGVFLWCTAISPDLLPGSEIIEEFNDMEEAKAALLAVFAKEVLAVLRLTEKAVASA